MAGSGPAAPELRPHESLKAVVDDFLNAGLYDGSFVVACTAGRTLSWRSEETMFRGLPPLYV
jgi:hypothetical protein